ncbi:MAG TPA: class I SAM-dependent methyltransferase [Gaiellaceae bacterium]|nr:class I SAM-dependent methyltransferase [Gaiellaceae bacterium]
MSLDLKSGPLGRSPPASEVVAWGALSRQASRITNYHAFARFYDAVQGDGAERAAFIRQLIARHAPSASTVLELACGTGSILEHLQADYEVTGLDTSAPMLEVASVKLPEVRLVEADMTQFELGERFDVVLCVYDSINHLLEYRQWEAVFDRADEHLDRGGIFLFDINTERRLAALSDLPPSVHWFGEGHLLVMKVQGNGDGGVVWSLRIFEHQGGDRYLLHSEDIREVSFPRRRIEESLRQRFRRVWAHDERRQRATSASGRIHFVAMK